MFVYFLIIVCFLCNHVLVVLKTPFTGRLKYVSFISNVIIFICLFMGIFTISCAISVEFFDVYVLVSGDRICNCWFKSFAILCYGALMCIYYRPNWRVLFLCFYVCFELWCVWFHVNDIFVFSFIYYSCTLC